MTPICNSEIGILVVIKVKASPGYETDTHVRPRADTYGLLRGTGCIVGTRPRRRSTGRTPKVVVLLSHRSPPLAKSTDISHNRDPLRSVGIVDTCIYVLALASTRLQYYLKAPRQSKRRVPSLLPVAGKQIRDKLDLTRRKANI